MNAKIESFCRPIEDGEVQWRVSRCGVSERGVWAYLVPYVDCRCVMDRLDKAFGPENWEDSYEVTAQGVLGVLTVHLEGQTIRKSDAGITSQAGGVKGAVSDALKRCAVKLGLGRELYEAREVLVSGEAVQKGYPPNNGRGYVKIYRKADGKQEEIKAWCRVPKLAQVLNGRRNGN